MTPNELIARLECFAKSALTASRALLHNSETMDMARQFRRAATGAYMNYAAASNGRSHRDFTAKLGVASEEADECCRWARLITHVNATAFSAAPSLIAEAGELRAILRAAYLTARGNQQ